MIWDSEGEEVFERKGPRQVFESGSFGESDEGTQAGVNAVGKEGASAKA